MTVGCRVQASRVPSSGRKKQEMGTVFKQWRRMTEGHELRLACSEGL